MKASVISSIAALALMLAACHKTGRIDTGYLEENFRIAEPSVQLSADRAVTAIKTADYPSAMHELNSIVGDTTITPEQRHAAKVIIARLERRLH